jgi:hypothetical protein
MLGGPLDFVFIDALHTYDAVLADFRGVLPFLADNAHVLFHDTYHQGIDQAISAVVNDNSDLFDCGFITRNPAINDDPVSGQGLRLVRKGAVNGEALIAEAYQRANRAVPPFDRKLWNFDRWGARQQATNHDVHSERSE